jgi:hypothetical protein
VSSKSGSSERILTKPDLIDKGAEDKIIKLVEEKQES